MSNNNNQINVPEAKEAMNRFKMECANEVGVNLKQGYNGDLSSREAGSVGGQRLQGSKSGVLCIHTAWRYNLDRVS